MKSTFSERKLFLFFGVSVFGLILGLLSVSVSQQSNSQMMNPNMMGNGSSINPMFMQAQNISGSIKLAPTLINSIASQIKVSLSDAASIVQNQSGNNSKVIAAHLDIANGYLTYTVIAVDPDANIHRYVIDAGNGSVLSSSVVSLQNMMMFGDMMGHSMMGNMIRGNMTGNMMGPMMMNPNMMGPMMALR